MKFVAFMRGINVNGLICLQSLELGSHLHQNVDLVTVDKKRKLYTN
jgi:hypothetical protein